MPLGPIDTAPLFRPLLAELVGVLRSLESDDWVRPTVAGLWRVCDVAAHLLDNDLRRLAAGRDGHLAQPSEPIRSPADLARLVHHLNAGGVSYATRLSPRLITDLLEITGAWVADLMTALPRCEPALWAVSWAGEDESENWMDTAREYTERWHHQQQIRDAVGRPLLLEPRWLVPLLDVSVRALPFTYAGTVAETGSRLCLAVNDSPESTWTLTRLEGRWDLGHGPAAHPTTVVAMSGDTAWRLFYNALPIDALGARVSISGDTALAQPLLRARSIVL